MPLANHSLANEFPEMRDRIHEMKLSNTHFARLFNEYDQVEHSVHRIESGAESTSDDYLDSLKRKRVSLKDKLFAMLMAA